MSAAIPFRIRAVAAVGALLGDGRMGRAFDLLFNRYEAAMPGSPRRTWLPAFTRDARYDATAFTRWEMVRKIRYFERNCWLVKKIQEQFVKYTVGPFGLQVMPASSDEKWNSAMAEAYGEWCKSPCLDSRRPMSAVHKLIAGEFDLDGEIFVLKTRDKDPGKPSMPKIQLIESHRCSTPGFESSDAYDDGWIDGVKVDAITGKPIAYALRDDLAGAEWTSRPASSVIHIFESPRVGMWRGITPYHAVLNTLHDLDDLGMYEMQRAKDAAAISIISTTWNGEADPNRIRQERFLQTPAGSPSSPNNPPDDALQKRVSQYMTVFGPRTLYLRPGEKAEQFKNETPSASQQWYYEYVIAQICSARGIPTLLVRPESLQGTVSRAVLDDANLYFKSKWQIFAAAAEEIYLYFAEWAKNNLPQLADPPADWRKCHVAQPRAVNVDVGRNSAAMLAELASCTKSFESAAAADGTTFETIVRQNAKAIKLIHKIADEEGIEAAELRSPIADVLQKLALADQASATAEAAKETPEPAEKNEA